MERKWPMRGTGCGTENDILVDLVRGDLPLKAEGPHFGYTDLNPQNRISQYVHVLQYYTIETTD